MNLWPDVEDPLERCSRVWNLDGEFPLPYFQYKCPICTGSSARIKDFKFHIKKDSPSKYRCDVVFKCIHCSAVWAHGVIVPEKMFLVREGRNYSWREARDIIEGNTKNEIYVYKAHNPNTAYEWCKITITINDKDDIDKLMGYMGDLIFMDIAHFNPKDKSLVRIVEDIKKITDTTSLANIEGAVHMVGKPLYEKEL